MKYIYTVFMLLMSKCAFADVLVRGTGYALTHHPFQVLIYATVCFFLPYFILLPLLYKRKKNLLLLCIILFIINFPFGEDTLIAALIDFICDYINRACMLSSTMPEKIAMIFPLFIIFAFMFVLNSWIVLKVKHKNWKYLLFQLSVLILFLCFEIFGNSLLFFYWWVYYIR